MILLNSVGMVGFGTAYIISGVHSSELWDSSAFAAVAARWCLLPASVLYGAGWQCYLSLYRFGIKKPIEAHDKVVCIGNLQVGGSGKTPFTLAIAEHLMGLGFDVVVATSGYGSVRSKEATMAPDGALSASEWGDESAMLRWLSPELKLVVGRGRVAAARLVHRLHPAAVMVMDDGFQHLPLKKQLTVVLDPESPGNRFCLPAGPYREPRRNRTRADLLVPRDLGIRYLPTQLSTPHGAVEAPDRYSVLCAVARPQKFLADLMQFCEPTNGFATVRLLRDHDPLSAGTLLESFPREFPIVVTAKDWVKLRERADCSDRKFLIAKQRLCVEGLERFERCFHDRIPRETA